MQRNKLMGQFFKAEGDVTNGNTDVRTGERKPVGFFTKNTSVQYSRNEERIKDAALFMNVYKNSLGSS